MSNPNLQELSLSNAALPREADKSGNRVQLPQLRRISLRGELDEIFSLLR